MIIETRKKPKVIEAYKGKILRDPKGALIVKLKKGKISVVSEDGSLEVLEFDTLTQRLVQGEEGILGKPTKKELSLGALLKRMEREKKRKKKAYLDVLVHFHKRFSLALTPLLFCLLAIPLSITFHRESKWSSLVISVVLFIGYYGLLSFFQNLVYKGIPAFLAVWMPNFCVFSVRCLSFLQENG